MFRGWPWMMREIVDDRHAADLRAHLQPPLHAPECCQRLADRLFADALAKGERGCGGRVQRIVLAGHAHRELGP